MGSLNSALQIGRSAILSYQAALQVVGSNVSGAAEPDYTRLTPGLDPLQGPTLGRDLQPGAGVALTSIQRNIDEALEGRLRLARGALASAAQQQTALARVETMVDNVNGTDVATRLTTFFRAFDDLQNAPEDAATRDLTIAAGAELAGALHDLRDQLGALGVDLDGQIEDLTATVNDLAARIARFNREITTAEAGGRGQATGLRDQRDALLREMSDLMDITVRQQADGAFNVYAGSEALVQGAQVRPLVAVTSTDGEFERTSLRFADSNAQVNPRTGRIAGLIAARDRHAFGQIAAVDELARAIIHDVNRIHADGQGLVGFKTVTGAQDLLDVAAPLDAATAGLAHAPRSGSFYVTVYDDATHTPLAYRINVDLAAGGGMSLTDLVDSFNAQVTGVTAAITSDHRIAFAADNGHSFVFGFDGQQARADTSGVLAALGVNTFFSGGSARDISVNSVLASNPLLIAAAAENLSGDGVVAGRIAALDSMPSGRPGGLTLPRQYEALTTNVAVTAAAAHDAQLASSTVLSTLQTQKESISGVNLDEEAIALVKYERAFQGAARYVSVVNDLISQLVTLIR